MLAIFTLFSLAYAEINPEADPCLQGSFWRNQALTDLIPFWEKTLDQKSGGYFTDVQNDGTIGSNPRKYPRMVSRLVYGFSTAYLLSGDEKYLKLAKHGIDYLTQYGWDRTNGGWYTELGADNLPTVKTKDLFDQTYGNLGPIFYYYVTGSQDALNLVKTTHQLLKTKAWDRKFGGYYGLVEADWNVTQTDKSFNAQIDTATAYLIYYYLVSKDPQLLNDLNDIGKIAIEKMYDPKTQTIRENFSQEWDFLGSYLGGPEQIDIGHNLKTTWVLLRLYQLTGSSKYLHIANQLSDTLLKTAWDNQYFGWYFTKNVNQPVKNDREKVKCWWTQTEGDFMLLNLYHITKNPLYLDYFKKNARFWNNYMVDPNYHEVYSYVSDSGKPVSNKKANLYKSAYHSMEHALMNYLYTQLYIGRQPVELNFKFSNPEEGTKHFVRIVEDPDVIIQKVQINGESWEKFNPTEGYIVLPKGDNLKVKVSLRMK